MRRVSRKVTPNRIRPNRIRPNRIRPSRVRSSRTRPDHPDRIRPKQFRPQKIRLPRIRFSRSLRAPSPGSRAERQRLRRSRTQLSRHEDLLQFEHEAHPLEQKLSKSSSWTLSVLADICVLVGLAAILSGAIGLPDLQALRFVAVGFAILFLTLLVRTRITRPAHVQPGQVFAGIGTVWVLLWLLGGAINLLTGTFSRPADALFESAAGFTTTAVTILDIDSDTISNSVLLWRASNSWIGGLVGIAIAVLAMPLALRKEALLGFTSAQQGYDLVPNSSVGLRRIIALYVGFTMACIVGYALTGVDLLEATVIAFGTVSTGGFAPHADSLSGYGMATSIVATAGMLAAGSGVFVLWWLIKGRLQPLMRSQELHAYLFLVAATVAVIAATTDVGPREALFTAASVISTTGFAILDWTAWPEVDTDVLIVVVAVGAMLGSAGGGVRIMRARLLFGYAARELRLQLSPNSVVPVRRGDTAVNERTLERVGSYVVSHVAVVFVGALLLGITGLSVSGSFWGSISAVSTLGPAAGEIGAFGQVDELSRVSRWVLVPLMLAGRVAILPLLAFIMFALHGQRMALRRTRLVGWQAIDHFDLLYRFRKSRLAKLFNRASANDIASTINNKDANNNGDNNDDNNNDDNNDDDVSSATAQLDWKSHR